MHNQTQDQTQDQQPKPRKRRTPVKKQPPKPPEPNGYDMAVDMFRHYDRTAKDKLTPPYTSNRDGRIVLGMLMVARFHDVEQPPRDVNSARLRLLGTLPPECFLRKIINGVLAVKS